MRNNFRCFNLLATLAAFLWAVTVSAADKDKKVDPSGTWKTTYSTQVGETRNSTLKLKWAEGKLSGTVTGRSGTDSEIQEGKFEGDQIIFKTVRERDGEKFTINFKGKVTGDDLKGEMSGSFNGTDWQVEFTGKREGGAPKVEEKAKPGLAGTWTWQFDRDGTVLNSKMIAKQDGEKVTGTITTNEREGKIEDGLLKNGDLTMQVTREWDGNKFVVKYQAKLEGDTLTGKVTVKLDGEDRVFDWVAKRAKE